MEKSNSSCHRRSPWRWGTWEILGDESVGGGHLLERDPRGSQQDTSDNIEAGKAGRCVGVKHKGLDSLFHNEPRRT